MFLIRMGVFVVADVIKCFSGQYIWGVSGDICFGILKWSYFNNEIIK